jgi:3'-phosphoadenosine 5'-phosphosulfate sulfotransferase (PAPS reductase)/FAD synthetase
MDKTGYLLHARLSSYRRLVSRTLDFVRNVIETSERPYIACSWGKDSLCVLHLALQIKQDVDVIWVTTDRFDEWPDIERVAGDIIRCYPSMRLHKAQAMPITDCYRRVGHFYIFAETLEEQQADRDYSRSFVRAITGKAQELGCDCALIGLRKDESKRRRLLLTYRGHDIYAKTHAIREAFPIADWTGRDVWAYILSNNIPYPALYDMAQDRETARNGAMFAANIQERGAERHYAGQLAALKHMYPELFNEFAAEFPEVRLYV